jgi:hypothetical protein
MILSPSDRLRFFPTIELTGGTLLGALQSAQNTAEAVTGRSLELAEYSEVYEVMGRARSVFLRHWPIRTDKPVQVFTKQNESEILVAPSEFAINSDGVLAFNSSQYPRWFRVVYWSGFDFANENTADTQAIKAAVAAFLLYQSR